MKTNRAIRLNAQAAAVRQKIEGIFVDYSARIIGGRYPGNALPT